MKQRFFTILIFLLACSALQTSAQNPATPQLTAEQNNALSEAARLSQTVIDLNREKKFDEALPLARRAVELRRGVLGDNNALVADALTNLAGLHLSKRDFERAEVSFKEALSTYDKAKFVSAQTAYALEALTTLRWRARDYEKAEIYAKRTIEVKEKLYGVRSLELIESLYSLIRVYEAKDELQQTSEVYERILSLVETHPDSLSNRLAQLLVSFHCSNRELKQTDATLAANRRIETLLGWEPGKPQAPLVGGVLNGKALLLARPAYPEEARRAGASGTVVVEVEIDECGKVTAADVLSGAIELRPASRNAAMKARFSPTLLGRIPVRVKGTIQYNFVHQGPIN